MSVEALDPFEAVAQPAPALQAMIGAITGQVVAVTGAASGIGARDLPGVFASRRRGRGARRQRTGREIRRPSATAAAHSAAT